MARLEATQRDDFGSRKCRALRETGRVPGIIYGHKRQPQPVTVSHHDLEVALLHGERVLEVDVGGQGQNVMVKDVQYDTFGHQILHVDLARVRLDERVTVTVPIVLRGTPVGAEEDGVLNQVGNEVELECTVRSIPDEIAVSVTHLGVGDSLWMRDLPLPEGAVLVDDADLLVCNVTIVSEEVEEAAPEEAEAVEGEPEVVGEKKEEEPPADET